MLDLKREQFNINDIITNAIDDITIDDDSVNSGNIQILYQPQDIILKADKGRITQVISNLLPMLLSLPRKAVYSRGSKVYQ
jgi:signal transduction histidine kinase